MCLRRCVPGPPVTPRPGRKVWATLADLGVTALAVGEDHDGIGAHPVDLVVALERVGAALCARPGHRIDRRRADPVGLG